MFFLYVNVASLFYWLSIDITLQFMLSGALKIGSAKEGMTFITF